MLGLLMAHMILTPDVEVGLVRPLSEVVIYEANLRAEGSHGAFRSLAGRVEAIKNLGVNVLWLMPVQPVGKLRSAGGLGSPYATADFDALNPEFGSEADFQHLVETAHKQKVAVIIDWVANHTAWDHPWIKSHPEWYRQDASGKIIIPPGTNWQDVAALDYTKAGMRESMIASMEGWIKRYGVDGFRCDSADFLPFDFWKTAITRLRGSSKHRILMLSEGTRDDQYTAGFDLNYGWDFAGKLREVFKGAKATEIGETARKEHTRTPATGSRLRFITNHDESAWNGTLLDFYKTPEGVKAAFVISSLYNGTPLIYSGLEVLFPNRIPIFEKTSIDWKANPSMEHWIASVLSLRQAHPALCKGSTTDYPNDDAVVFTRQEGNESVLVLANVRPKPANVSLAEKLQGGWRNLETRANVHLESQLMLPPYGYLILAR